MAIPLILAIHEKIPETAIIVNFDEIPTVKPTRGRRTAAREIFMAKVRLEVPDKPVPLGINAEVEQIILFN